jgi:hypothetical protein
MALSHNNNMHMRAAPNDNSDLNYRRGCSALTILILHPGNMAHSDYFRFRTGPSNRLMSHKYITNICYELMIAERKVSWHLDTLLYMENTI